MDTNPDTTGLDHDDEDHDRGLQFDLSALVGRRRLLGLFAGGVGAAALTACGLAERDAWRIVRLGHDGDEPPDRRAR